jgi:hypothetical protein
MPSKKEHLMVQAVFALSQGCGGADIDAAACKWFHEHYFDWIDTPKKNPKAKGRAPQEVWSRYGKDFLERFRSIGRGALAQGRPIGAKALRESALTVEQQSDCPWCPDKL